MFVQHQCHALGEYQLRYVSEIWVTTEAIGQFQSTFDHFWHQPGAVEDHVR